jgi:hypothetical protein
MDSDTDQNTHPFQEYEQHILGLTTRIRKLEERYKDAIEKLNEVMKVNQTCCEKVQTCYKASSKLEETVRRNEINIANLNQYGRRQSVEFCNIPESIQPKALEGYVLKMLEAIGMKLTPYNIVAVHRLAGRRNQQNPRNVVCRFLNRKHAYQVLSSKRKLNNINQYKKIYIIENLCPYNKQLFNRLYKHKKEGNVYNVWSYNGLVYVNFEPNGERYCVEHMDEVDGLLFPEEELDDGEETYDQRQSSGSSTGSDRLDRSHMSNSSTETIRSRRVSSDLLRDNVVRNLASLSDVNGFQSPVTPVVG